MDFTNKKQLDQLTEYVNKLSKMKYDSKFQEFIQEKCVNVLQQVMSETLIGGTTNDSAIEEYMRNNYIEEFTDGDVKGFILFNNTKIPANTSTPENYGKEGQFNLALAFEYGVGIIGQETAKPNAWEYNVHGYTYNWYYKNEEGVWTPTKGYEGFQVYTNTANIIEQNLADWVTEYLQKEVQ